METKWEVTLKSGKKSIVVLLPLWNVNDVLSHFENEVGFRPASITKLN